MHNEPWGIGTSKIDDLFVSEHQIETAFRPVWDGISTGIPELDHKLGGGLRRGDLTAFMGEHGVGKSELLVEVCRNVLRERHRCLFVSIEMQTKDIMARLARMCTQKELSRIADHLLITDKCMTNASQIIELSTAVKPEAIFIDNLILVRHEYGDYAGDVALKLKDAAAEANIPLVCTIPLKPRGKARKAPYPSDLSDLRSTSLNEYTTDHAVFIHYDGSLTVDKTRWIRSHIHKKPWTVKDYYRPGTPSANAIEEGGDRGHVGLLTQEAMKTVLGEGD